MAPPAHTPKLAACTMNDDNVMIHCTPAGPDIERPLPRPIRVDHRGIPILPGSSHGPKKQDRARGFDRAQAVRVPHTNLKFTTTLRHPPFPSLERMRCKRRLVAGQTQNPLPRPNWVQQRPKPNLRAFQNAHLASKLVPKCLAVAATHAAEVVEVHGGTARLRMPHPVF